MKQWSLLILFVLTGCAGPIRDLYPDDPDRRPVPVYLVSHGWHVGVALEADQIRPLLPSHPDMPRGSYLMFGWGDEKYYTNSDAGFWLMLRAALIPTSSVIHVVGIDRPIDQYFPSSTVIEIKVTENGAEQLARYIGGYFRTENEKPIVAADGLYRNSLFFAANERYYFPKTSNMWSARALRQTGYPITPFFAITSGNVVKQAKKDGVIIQE